jgi:outer membrane protein assembly complex protein YaeT
VSGATIIFQSLGQFAPKAAIGGGMIGFNGCLALIEAPKVPLLPCYAPVSHSSGLDTDTYAPSSLTPGDAEAPTSQKSDSNPVRGSSSLPTTDIAETSNLLPESREPGTRAVEELENDEIIPKSPDQRPEAILSRGGLTFSGGYSSVEGPNVEAKIARRNIGGLNREVSASARYSKIQRLIEIGYADATFLGGRAVFASTLFGNQQSATGFGGRRQSTPFTQSARGINIHLSRKFESGLSLSTNYRLSADSFHLRSKAAPCNTGFFGSPICNALGTRTSSILSLAVTLDRRDSATDPSRGFKLRLTQDLAGLGGSTRYTRTRFGGEAYVGLTQDLTLSLGAEAGFMTSIRKGNVPLFDRFYIGGTSMRGFDLRGIGPKVRPTAAGIGQNVAIGGRAYYALRAELAVPVGGFLGDRGLQPSLFVDAGSVFGARRSGLLPGETLIGNSAKPRVTVGVGLSLNTPAGKLRLDFARPIVKQSGDRSRMFSISFGSAV